MRQAAPTQQLGCVQLCRSLVFSTTLNVKEETSPWQLLLFWVLGQDDSRSAHQHPWCHTAWDCCVAHHVQDERIISAEYLGEAAGSFRCLCVLIVTPPLQCICLVKSCQREGMRHILFLVSDKLVWWEFHSSNKFFPMSPSPHPSFLFWAGFTSWHSL